MQSGPDNDDPGQPKIIINWQLKAASPPHSGRVGSFSMWLHAEKSLKILSWAPHKPEIIVWCDLAQIMTSRSAQIIKLAAESWVHRLILGRVGTHFRCDFMLRSRWKSWSEHLNFYNHILGNLAQIMTSRSAQIIKLAAERWSTASFWTSAGHFRCDFMLRSRWKSWSEHLKTLNP